MECGFALYAEHLGGIFGSARTSVFELHYKRARPEWEKLTPHEKQIWTKRAFELALIDARRRCIGTPINYSTYSHYFLRSRRHQRATQSTEDFAHLTFGVGDNVEEDEFRAVGRLINALEDGEYLTVQWLAEKFEIDRAMVRHKIMKQTNGCIDKIKELRFLIAAVQTFGNMDGMCLMAEYAMNEFSLKDGIADKFSTLVGPWQIHNDIQRRRAEIYSNETHRIPLTIKSTEMDKRQLVTEILGRCEPNIALQQGMQIGLYTEEMRDLEDCLNRLYVDDKSQILIVQYPHILADDDGRRWIICLKQEFWDMLAASRHLARSMGLHYADFPCQERRYVLADAFLCALADCLQGEAVAEAQTWLSALGKHLPEKFVTPWERSDEPFCDWHCSERNSCCAAVTVSRASYIILHSVQQLLK